MRSRDLDLDLGRSIRPQNTSLSALRTRGPCGPCHFGPARSALRAPVELRCHVPSGNAAMRSGGQGPHWCAASGLWAESLGPTHPADNFLVDTTVCRVVVMYICMYTSQQTAVRCWGVEARIPDSNDARKVGLKEEPGVDHSDSLSGSPPVGWCYGGYGGRTVMAGVKASCGRSLNDSVQWSCVLDPLRPDPGPQLHLAELLNTSLHRTGQAQQGAQSTRHPPQLPRHAYA